MQYGRSLRVWVWVIAVLGYVLLPVVAVVSVLGADGGAGPGGASSTGVWAVGGIAGGGMVVIPVLTWVITVALHRERRAHGERAVDGVLLNWVGGILVAGLVVATFGSAVLPRVSDYLERHGQESVAHSTSVTGWPQPV